MDRIWYGGHYNPEQWDPAVWADDVRLMRRANVTVATVGVFSWAQLEPADGQFEFGWLDDILDRLHTAGIRVDLATATASPPPWMATAHPDILPVTADGVRLGLGSRQHYSPSSATYRGYAERLVRTLAERYAAHPALEAWHVNNELACHVPRDYSEESAIAFRAWLIDRYGLIDELNRVWGTAFWSQRYSTFDEVQPPRAMPTFGNPTQLLDFDRFSSDAWRGVLQSEVAILREVSPGVPITTNFMGFFQAGDYWAWAEDLDFISDDHYIDPADPEYPWRAAMTRDLMRSLAGGDPWILMEQATSAVNWRSSNAAIPAGVHRAMSLQAVARGADGIMQFQWRQSVAGAEKFHSAMVPHAGEDSRIFRQTVALGKELAGLSHLVGTRIQARVAILIDWNSWWTLEQAALPARVDYLGGIGRWYRELWQRNVGVDFVRAGAPLDSYDAVIVPGAVCLSADGVDECARFAEAGGQLVVSYMSAILDENLHIAAGGYLGGLRATLGVSIEEFAPPAAPARTGGGVPALQVRGVVDGAAREWGEVLRADTARVLATFSGGILDGLPAVTRNTVGSGAGWYVATAPDGLARLVDLVLADARVEGIESPDGVEIVWRGGSRFVLNHCDAPVEVDGVTLGAYDARVVRTENPAAPVSP